MVRATETFERQMTLEEMAMRDVMRDNNYTREYRNAMRCRLCDEIGFIDIVDTVGVGDYNVPVGKFTKIIERIPTPVEEMAYRYIQLNMVCKSPDMICGSNCPFNANCILIREYIDKCAGIIERLTFVEV